MSSLPELSRQHLLHETQVPTYLPNPVNRALDPQLAEFGAIPSHFGPSFQRTPVVFSPFHMNATPRPCGGSLDFHEVSGYFPSPYSYIQKTPFLPLRQNCQLHHTDHTYHRSRLPSWMHFQDIRFFAPPRLHFPLRDSRPHFPPGHAGVPNPSDVYRCENPMTGHTYHFPSHPTNRHGHSIPHNDIRDRCLIGQTSQSRSEALSMEIQPRPFEISFPPGPDPKTLPLPSFVLKSKKGNPEASSSEKLRKPPSPQPLCSTLGDFQQAEEDKTYEPHNLAEDVHLLEPTAETGILTDSASEFERESEYDGAFENPLGELEMTNIKSCMGPSASFRSCSVFKAEFDGLLYVIRPRKAKSPTGKQGPVDKAVGLTPLSELENGLPPFQTLASALHISQPLLCTLLFQKYNVKVKYLKHWIQKISRPSPDPASKGIRPGYSHGDLQSKVTWMLRVLSNEEKIITEKWNRSEMRLAKP